MLEGVVCTCTFEQRGPYLFIMVRFMMRMPTHLTNSNRAVNRYKKCPSLAITLTLTATNAVKLLCYM